MCTECENDYEKLIACYAQLEAENKAIKLALDETLKSYERLCGENYQLVVNYAHLQKKAYYDNRT